MEIPLEDTEAFSRVGEALSKEARVRIIRELSYRETITLSELERLMIKKYGGPQKSTIQLHLAKLESAGIVETRKEREGPKGQTIVRIFLTGIPHIYLETPAMESPPSLGTAAVAEKREKYHKK